ncbi:hypothetical protein Q0F99_19505 [Rathayibacter oskolensis]|uniref:hypothetical protein n=1 Tax=Rathayibacter oskolensis TaxID=1891671 RepID=UPI00266019E7|nr:hypothetical protein [Rathayibacter oskolensis]WKK71513.1 hypothetical protein Q0F99_19505 [Rathayibacter oskolensis]
MAATVLIVLLAVVSALAVGAVSRRVLGAPVGWPRSVVVGLLVFATGLPFGVWVSEQTGIVSAGRATDATSAWVAILTVVVAVAWVFALGVGALVALELFWPTASLRNPIDVVRGAIRRRRRTKRYLQILAIASRHGLGWIFHDRSSTGPSATTAQQRARRSSTPSTPPG